MLITNAIEGRYPDYKQGIYAPIKATVESIALTAELKTAYRKTLGVIGKNGMIIYSKDGSVTRQFNGAISKTNKFDIPLADDEKYGFNLEYVTKTLLSFDNNRSVDISICEDSKIKFEQDGYNVYVMNMKL